MTLASRAISYRGFFDRDAVLSRVGPAAAKILSRFGAAVMTTARGSIRTDRTKAQRPSKPGRPPKSRQGALRDNIFFFFDAVKEEVVIGPVALNRPSTRSRLPVPALHEFGGYATVTSFGQSVRAQYPARPYMRPAFKKNVAKVALKFANSIRR